jgi:hypothetical protein
MKPEGPAASWFEPYQAVPAAFAKQTGALAPLQASEWKARRNEVHKKWADLLGRPATPRPLVSAREVATHHEPTYTGKLMYLRVEPDYEEKIYLMLPTGPITRALPVVVVPFYDVDSPVGRAMGGRNFSPPGVRSYAHLAVQQGFAAVAIRWFGESYGENYAEAVANLKQRHPQLTGLGKWVWDSQRLLDYLEKIPQIDARRIGMMGHSLGGKMTLYATAMDERIRVAVSSEPGIGLSFSNYEDFWYLGERIRDLPSGSDHHELLALIAPRPFLLIGGDSADNDKSWHYINAAKPVYALFTKPEHIAYVNHRKGHSPTPEAVKLSMEWLRRFLSDPSSQP